MKTANEIARGIISSHKTSPLTDTVLESLEGIIKEADRSIGDR
jgi:hypothetical protein